MKIDKNNMANAFFSWIAGNDYIYRKNILNHNNTRLNIAFYSSASTSAFLRLLRKIIPIIKQIAATPIGYQSPANGSPAGFELVLLDSYNIVAIKGVRPPNTPLPMW